MAEHCLNLIRNVNGINAVSLSLNGELVACGGWDSGPITIWTVASGELVGELRGFRGEVHRLAFSPLGDRLAAISIYGEIWVWELSGRQMVSSKPPEDSRRWYSISFSESQPDREFPFVVSDALNGTLRRARSSNGDLIATLRGMITVQKRGKEISRLDLAVFPAFAGARDLFWSADSQSIALTGEGWVGVWHLERDELFASRLPSGLFVYGADYLRSSHQVVCATGATSLTLVDLPAEAELDQMAQLREEVDESVPEVTSWEWDINYWGHEGVCLESEGLLWYSHRHNTLDGNALASFQTFEDFRKEGTCIAVPEQVLREVVRAVESRLRVT